MGRPRKEPLEGVEEPKEEIREEPKHTLAHVYSRTDQLVRTYSKEVHGENFESLAHEFADPREHEVRLA